MENLQHQLNRYFVDNGATEWWLTGLKTTLLVTVIALCIGVVLGLLIALIRSTHEQTTTMHHLSPMLRREGLSLSRSSGCQGLVRFFALLRIKPHTPLLVRAPVNSFEFQPCGRTPQVGYLLC